MTEDDAPSTSRAPEPASPARPPARAFNTLEMSFLEAGAEMDRAAAAVPPDLAGDDPTETVSLTHRLFRAARDRARGRRGYLAPVVAAAVVAGLGIVGLVALRARPLPAVVVAAPRAAAPAKVASPPLVAAPAAKPAPAVAAAPAAPAVRAKVAAKSRPRSNASATRKTAAPKEQTRWFWQLSKR